jgi:hypothetical protein
MKLTPLASNMTEVEIGDKTVLFSYKIPVAYHDSTGVYRTNKYWSKTTSKHINKWLKWNNFSIAFPAPKDLEQAELDALTGGK